MINKKKIIRSVSSMGLCSVVSAVLSIFQLSIVARFLTPEDYGVFAIANIIVGAGGAFLAGVPLAIIQRDSFTEAEASSMQNWVYLVAVGLVLITVCIGGAFELINGSQDFFFLVTLLAAIFLITSLGQMHQVWLRRDLQMDRIAVANVVGAAVSVITAVVLAWFGAGYWAIGYAAVVRAIVTMTMVRTRSGWTILPSSSLVDARPLLKFGLSRGLDQTLGQFTSKVDQIAIGAFLGSSSLGLYNVASNVARRPFDLIQPILSSVMFPIYARLKSDKGVIQEAFDGSVQLIAIIMGTIALGVCMLSSEIIWLLLGPKWESLTTILSIIPFYFALLLMGVPMRQIAQASGHSKRLLLWNLFSSLVVVGIIVPGVMFRGELYFVSMLLCVAQFILYIISFFVLLRGTDVDGAKAMVNSIFRVLLPYTACMCVMFNASAPGVGLRGLLLIVAIGGCMFFNYKKLVEFYRICSE